MRKRERVPDKEGKRAALIALIALAVLGIPLWLLMQLNEFSQGLECFGGCR